MLVVSRKVVRRSGATAPVWCFLACANKLAPLVYWTRLDDCPYRRWLCSGKLYGAVDRSLPSFGGVLRGRSLTTAYIATCYSCSGICHGAVVRLLPVLFVCCAFFAPPNVRGRLPDCSNNYRTEYDSTTGTRVPVRKRRNRPIASN